MNLIDRIRDALGFGPKLRNKRNGMAWINSTVDEGGGTAALVNRVVRTVRVRHSDFWEIDPPQDYCAEASLVAANGATAERGDRVRVIAIRDACLTPIPGDLVDGEEIPREFFVAPKLPQEV